MGLLKAIRIDREQDDEDLVVFGESEHDELVEAEMAGFTREVGDDFSAVHPSMGVQVGCQRVDGVLVVAVVERDADGRSAAKLMTDMPILMVVEVTPWSAGSTSGP